AGSPNSVAVRRHRLPETLLHVEESIAELAPRGSRWRSLARAAGWSAVVLDFVFALLVLALRYWLLPLAGAHPELIERKASQMLGERVTIGAIEAGWQGLRPELLLSNVTVYERSGRPALTLPEIDPTCRSARTPKARWSSPASPCTGTPRATRPRSNGCSISARS